ncbi:MAG TPA: TlpA disulfide reductase family protein [Saprospiraceae bacterium]|nr:TlpA disulfide reductase family protein [Saprospiraceae bacterium]HMQ83805.1 TlpA disulfide reductase family protein [Saprospiraceae bacterium]
MKRLSVKNVPFLVIGIFLLIMLGKYVYQLPRFHQGEIAPNFTANLLHGAPFELSDLKGRYVLLDFWGSWCGPCRAEHPALVALSRELENTPLKDAEGFSIVSIAIESDENRWKRAIEQDGLYWSWHIMDKTTSFRFFNSKIAQLYGVKSIPAKYLIDPKGNIIATNPSIAQIRQLMLPSPN